MSAFHSLGLAIISAILFHGRFFDLCVFSKEFIVDTKVLDLFEALHLFELLDGHITELIDADFETSCDGVMRSHQVQVLLEDG
jgi:hypothetical protein